MLGAADELRPPALRLGSPIHPGPDLPMAGDPRREPMSCVRTPCALSSQQPRSGSARSARSGSAPVRISGRQDESLEDSEETSCLNRSNIFSIISERMITCFKLYVTANSLARSPIEISFSVILILFFTFIDLR